MHSRWMFVSALALSACATTQFGSGRLERAEASIKANKRIAKLATRTKFQGVLLAFTITWAYILTVDLSYEIHEVATLKTEVEKLKKKGE